MVASDQDRARGGRRRPHRPAGAHGPPPDAVGRGLRPSRGRRCRTGRRRDRGAQRHRRRHRRPERVGVDGADGRRRRHRRPLGGAARAERIRHGGAGRSRPSAACRAIRTAVGRHAVGRPARRGQVRCERPDGRSDRERVRTVQDQRRRDGLLARPDRHTVRGRARPRCEGREDHAAVEQHRLRRRVERRAHPRTDPRQERDRHRDPERRPRDGRARRRAALERRPQVDAPADDRCRQGRLRRLRRGEPGQDAPPSRGRLHRVGKIQLRELDDHEPADAREAERRPDGPGRPEARRADQLCRRSAPDHTHHHEPEEGSRGAAVGREGDGHALRRPRVVRVPPASTTSTRRSSQARSSSRQAASACSSRTRTSSSSSTSSPI